MPELFKNRTAELSFLVSGAFVVLAFWGNSAQGRISVLGNRIQNYVEDKAIAYDGAQGANSQVADIGSIFGGTSTVGTGKDPIPTSDDTAIQGSTVVAWAPPDMSYLDSFKSDQVVKYTVKSGDTIGSIASNFGVSINTIIWANNLKNPNILALGQALKIPPVTGVIHTVRSGDTVASIAKKYKADPDKILAFNNVSKDQALDIGNDLMIPGGQISGPLPVVSAVARHSVGSGIYVPVGDGQCVAFVQAHGFSHFHGNAYQWKKYINTSNPSPGGVVVLLGGRFGHVALITAVTLNSVQIVEQNYFRPYVVDHREISLGDRSIVGFIGR